jgi:hypothetical protein
VRLLAVDFLAGDDAFFALDLDRVLTAVLAGGFEAVFFLVAEVKGAASHSRLTARDSQMRRSNRKL